MVYAYARKHFDKWRIAEMPIEIESGEQFHLKAQHNPEAFLQPTTRSKP